MCPKLDRKHISRLTESRATRKPTRHGEADTATLVPVLQGIYGSPRGRLEVWSSPIVAHALISHIRHRLQHEQSWGGLHLSIGSVAESTSVGYALFNIRQSLISRSERQHGLYGLTVTTKTGRAMRLHARMVDTIRPGTRQGTRAQEHKMPKGQHPSHRALIARSREFPKQVCDWTMYQWLLRGRLPCSRCG